MRSRLTWEQVTPFPVNPISQGRLKNMRREWDGYYHGIVGAPAIFDNSALAFPEYPEDTLFIGDGNHRYVLACEDGRGSEEFMGHLYRGLTRAEMFKLRRGLNDRRTVKPAETFIALIEEGDLRRRAIKSAVEGAGWAITHDRAEGGLCCTNELEWIWDEDRGALPRAIQSYEARWGRSPTKQQARVLKGLGSFWARYPDADEVHLIKALKGVEVEQLYVSGRSLRASVTYIKSVFDGIRYTLAQEYNRTLPPRSKRLVL